MTAFSPQTCATDFTAAPIRRDMDAALGLLTDDVVFFYSNGSVIRGKDAFATLMTASWKVVENYTYTTLASAWVAGCDSGAAVIYSFEWSGTRAGDAVSGGGRGTRVFVKTPGGWLITHEHLSNGAW